MGIEREYVRAEEIIHRLRLYLPVEMKLPDPISGEEFAVDKKNVMNMLVLDVANLVLEAQTAAALYMEMGRLRRACQRAAAAADLDYRRWKSDCIMARRAMAEASGKKVTVDECEAYYRGMPEYKPRNELPTYYKNLADLFGDAQEAVQIKAKMIQVEQQHLGKTDRVLRTEDEMERLQDKALDVIGSGTPWSLPATMPPGVPPKMVADVQAQAQQPSLPVVDATPPPPPPAAAPVMPPPPAAPASGTDGKKKGGRRAAREEE